MGRLGLVLLAGAMVLSGCGDSTKRALGLSRTTPDEFSVVRRAPLSQPPDLTLRPPRPGAERPGVETPRQQARQAIFRQEDETRSRSRPALGTSILRGGAPAPSAAPQGGISTDTPGEAAFLERAGAFAADPNIRSTINREDALLADADVNFVQKLLDFKADHSEVVDAPAEARRLRENQALGLPANEGETPFIERKSNSLFNL